MERSGTAPELSLTLGCPSVQTSIPEPDRRVPWRSTLANPAKVDVYTNYPNSRPKVRDTERNLLSLCHGRDCAGPSDSPKVGNVPDMCGLPSCVVVQRMRRSVVTKSRRFCGMARAGIASTR